MSARLQREERLAYLGAQLLVARAGLRVPDALLVEHRRFQPVSDLPQLLVHRADAVVQLGDALGEFGVELPRRS